MWIRGYRAPIRHEVGAFTFELRFDTRVVHVTADGETIILSFDLIRALRDFLDVHGVARAINQVLPPTNRRAHARMRVLRVLTEWSDAHAGQPPTMDELRDMTDVQNLGKLREILRTLDRFGFVRMCGYDEPCSAYVTSLGRTALQEYIAYLETERQRDAAQAIYTPAQVAELLNLKLSAVYYLLRTGALRGFKQHGKWYIMRTAIEDFRKARDR
ncbi:MAG TPA: helix-turn-helix domain-containing protein [Herpetosiphonaceae bacterium]